MAKNHCSAKPFEGGYEWTSIRNRGISRRQEPRTVLFALLKPEAFQAVVDEQALDVGRQVALLPEEDIVGSGMQAFCLYEQMLYQNQK